MSRLVFILGDQLSFNISSLQDFDRNCDTVLMTELMDEATSVWHHQQKLVFVFASMRNFAWQLQAKGIRVIYTKLTDSNNTQSFTSELIRVAQQLQPQKIIITKPSEYRVLNDFLLLKQLPIEMREDDRFFDNHFASFATGKKKLLLEHFYRKMRLNTGILMHNNKPIGDKWNFDQENRSPFPKNATNIIKQIPSLPAIKHNQTVLEVISLVKQHFANNIGDAHQFNLATTAEQAQEQFSSFVSHRLPRFGDYQDAMHSEVVFGFHSAISCYLNIGLLDAKQCCYQVQDAYLQGKCSIQSAEAFIRQILGWREYIRGIYWHFMPQYQQHNFFQHRRGLPKFYWQYDLTNMNCLKQAIKQTTKFAYSHHIQRLMITGNFALLSEIDPSQVHQWYLAVYADAFEWVEMPNTYGMALFADGGIVASKPYCASANYINKMSNFCQDCRYNHKQTIGKDACPFNYLYWHFLAKNQDKLKNNNRMAYAYKNLNNKSDLAIIIKQAEDFLDNI